MNTEIKEIWKDVVGYEGQYEVSNLARVRSLKLYAKTTGRILKQKYIKKYISVPLSHKNKCTNCTVHRLVAKAFVPNPKKLKQVNHIDGDRSNNKASNLEWVSARENSCHAFKDKKGKDSKYIGVYKSYNCSTWYAKIYMNGAQHRFYGFKTDRDAYKKYLSVAKENGITNRYTPPLDTIRNLWSDAYIKKHKNR